MSQFLAFVPLLWRAWSARWWLLRALLAVHWMERPLFVGLPKSGALVVPRMTAIRALFRTQTLKNPTEESWHHTSSTSPGGCAVESVDVTYSGWYLTAFKTRWMRVIKSSRSGGGNFSIQPKAISKALIRARRTSLSFAVSTLSFAFSALSFAQSSERAISLYHFPALLGINWSCLLALVRLCYRQPCTAIIRNRVTKRLFRSFSVASAGYTRGPSEYGRS
jgi:hypothetical protein